MRNADGKAKAGALVWVWLCRSVGAFRTLERPEFGLQAGYLSTNYDPYQWKCPVDPDTDKEQYYYKWYGDAKDFQKRQHRFSWLGPTRVEITLSYDLLYRRNNKKGVSFRNRETTINY